jgi:hypothetical protein
LSGAIGEGDKTARSGPSRGRRRFANDARITRPPNRLLTVVRISQAATAHRQGRAAQGQFFRAAMREGGGDWPGPPVTHARQH